MRVINSSELARSFGVADTTIRRYLDLLAGTFVARILLPWHEKLGKRQVKAPRVYLSDSGLLHTLLGLPDRDAVERHPKVGASWEGFLLGQLIERPGARPEEVFFWATHAGAELDLLVVHGRTRGRGNERRRAGGTRPAPSKGPGRQACGPLPRCAPRTVRGRRPPWRGGDGRGLEST